MKPTPITAITFGMILCPAAAEAGPGIALTTDVEDDGIQRTMAAGDIVPVTFLVRSRTGDLILGMDFALACRGEGVRIHAVEFDPAFAFDGIRP